MSYLQLGEIDDKLKSTVLKVTDKLGITKYVDQLFSAESEKTDAGVPAEAPPPPPPPPETPWLTYGLMAGAGLLLLGALRR